MLKRGLQLIVVGFVILAAVVVVRGMSSATDSEQTASEVYILDVSRQAVASLMSQAIQYETISFGRDKPTSVSALQNFHAFLRQSYPAVHRTLSVEAVNEHSLLFHWRGSAGDRLKPVLLLGHMDVVPVVPGTQNEWEHPPFAGVNDGTYIWGRGALDDKINIITSLQALEMMIDAGLQPQRDIYLAFGHDEEQGGLEGAREIGKLLESRGVQPEFLVDEGGAIVEGAVPGMSKSLAVIAPAEKGIVTLELLARGTGGHSSMPTSNSSIGTLAQAIVKLESNQFPSNFKHTEDFLVSIADDLPLGQRIIMKNLWLFKPLVMRMFANDPQALAGMRTTTAVTVINGGVKTNVLPITATALVNFRILPGETPETVKRRVEEVINDPRITVSFSEAGQIGMAPSPNSPLEGFGWAHLTQAIRDTAAPADIAIAPRLLVAATDTRHYRAITSNHYRFTWFRAQPGDLGRIHGTNERVKIDDLVDAVRFYHRFISTL
jgi:carboxypeptidase PM20D1